MGCDESDVVNSPFVSGWQLNEQRCAESSPGSRCYEVALGVSDHEGDRAASWRIYPPHTDGSEYILDGATAPTDPDDGGAFIDGFSIQAGDTPVSEVVLPVINNDEFWRCQVQCDPGAPG
jgi:hypothetical protein